MAGPMEVGMELVTGKESPGEMLLIAYELIDRSAAARPGARRTGVAVVTGGDSSFAQGPTVELLHGAGYILDQGKAEHLIEVAVI